MASAELDLDLATEESSKGKAPALTAADLARKELTGTVDHVRFRNKADGFTIVGLKTGHAAKGRDENEELAKGQTFRFLGRWDASDTRGPTFRFDSFVIPEPATREAVVRYLVKLCDDIGERRASKLWGKYGPDTVRVLRSEPERVVADGLLAADVANDAAKELTKAAQFEDTKLDLFGIFAGRGFPGVLIEAAISTWGAKAGDIVRRDPFALLVNELPGCGFKRCDRLYIDRGKPADALKRQMLCGWDNVRSNSAGHTWIKVERVIDAIRETIPSAKVNPVRAIKLGIRAGWLAKHRDASEQLWIAEAEKARDEMQIGQAVAKLRQETTVMWPGEPLPGPSPDKPVSPHQQAAWDSIRLSRLCILTGGPGTGKTFTLAAILRLIVQQFGRFAVAVAAPTGKAAVRSTQAMQAAGVPLRATTIHKLLNISRNGHDGKGWGFQYHAGNPLPFKFVVVDETSMVSADLMASLLQACGEGCHVLLIGDPHQLPPVGHGAPLRDFIAAGIATAELTEIRRNAGTIVRACAAIKAGKRFDVDDRYEPEPTDDLGPRNLRLFETSSPKEAAELLDRTLSTLKSFDPVWQTQVIVALNKKSEISRSAINARLQLLLNPNGRAELGNPFRLDDKVICLKNKWAQVVRLRADCDPENAALATDAGNYKSVIVETENGSEEAETYVANGEIGRIEAISPKMAIARFSEGDELIRIPIGKQQNTETPDAADDDRGAAGDYDLAYAITAHKSQGSESPCVFVMIDEAAGMIASREWAYTAISRAAQLCVLIGKRATVDKQVRRVALTRRKTFLVERLTGAEAFQ